LVHTVRRAACRWHLGGSLNVNISSLLINTPICYLVSRESLKDIELRLLAAEEAAREAKDAVVGQADIAKMERERALAARTEAEQANKNLDSARYVSQWCVFDSLLFSLFCRCLSLQHSLLARCS